jgi:hypothetical protein
MEGSLYYLEPVKKTIKKKEDEATREPFVINTQLLFVQKLSL